MPNNQEPTVFIRSKNVSYRVILNVVVAIAMICLICTPFYREYVEHIPISDDFFEKWIGMAVIAGLFLFLTIGFLIKGLQALYKTTKPITFRADRITIGNDIISLSEISRIKVMDIGRITYESFYGATIYLLNGETKFIPEIFYDQSSLLFQRLEKLKREHLVENTEDDEVPQLSQEETVTDRFDFNILTSFDHLLFLSLLIMLLFGVVRITFNPAYPWYFASFFLLTCLFIYYFISKISYYFVLDDHHIEIRNRFPFRSSKVFKLNEIKGIILHPLGFGRNMRYGTRVVLSNYKSYYFASPFTNKKWRSLAEVLRKRGLLVENRISGSES
ncbi:hypothetical protein [Albibacterium profundi]|uniref:PH domain-containing protein n=1 Tax=Albibacterium profundi TaxID=3134906 RepID=A0ABV5CDH3_9SPHI